MSRISSKKSVKLPTFTSGEYFKDIVVIIHSHLLSTSFLIWSFIVNIARLVEYFLVGNFIVHSAYRYSNKSLGNKS